MAPSRDLELKGKTELVRARVIVVDEKATFSSTSLNETGKLR
jgi:hypothetical protein